MLTSKVSKQRLQKQKKTTKPEQLPSSSSPASSNNNHKSYAIDNNDDDKDVVNTGGEDDATTDMATATPEKTLLSFTPDSTPTLTTIDRDDDFIARVRKHFNSDGTTDGFSFFDPSPEELNERFPVVGRNDVSIVPGAAASAPAPEATTAQPTKRRNLSLVGRYSLSPTSFLNISPFRRSRPFVEGEAESEPEVTLKDALIAYITILVALGCFAVIMADGVRWMLGLVWGMFCGLMGWLLMLH